MIRRFMFAVFILFTAFGCIDRIIFDVPAPDSLGLSISGHISNNGGPHQVSIFKNFDIQQRDSVKVGISAKRVIISDENGSVATLSQVKSGLYQTEADEIVGRVGGVYKLTVEMMDGRIYESVPDTIPQPGHIDSTYYDFAGSSGPEGYAYYYTIYVASSFKSDLSKSHFMISDLMTFKATTRPEAEDGKCYLQKNGVCNFVHPCTGLLNKGKGFEADFVRVHPCECCTCWYEQQSDFILSDRLVASGGRFPFVQVDRVEQTGWNMMYKMRFEIRMQGLSNQAYRFWKGVRDQREGITDIFQPATGEIRGNMVQVEGTSSEVEGIFYASSLSTKSFYIRRGDEPEGTIPEFASGFGRYPCPQVAPNYMTTMPYYWTD